MAYMDPMGSITIIVPQIIPPILPYFQQKVALWEEKTLRLP